MLIKRYIKKITILIIFIVYIIILYNCHPAITRLGYDNNDQQKDECVVYTIKDSSLIFSEDEKVGEINIKDTGFSTNCSSDDVANILEEEACKTGANIINIKTIKRPDFWSSCYRVRAELIKLDTDSEKTSGIIEKYKYNLKEQNKYFNGVHIDSLSAPIPDIRFGINAEAIQPSGALGSYFYFQGFGFSYSYGFSSSKSETYLRDIKNVHHFKISVTALSLQNFRSYIPIYIGIGKSYYFEKSTVQGYTGDGTIESFQYFLGLRLLSDRKPFFNTLGVYIEFGKYNWNFDNSILKKNNADLIYNVHDFYFVMGLTLYIC